jgi:transposase
METLIDREPPRQQQAGVVRVLSNGKRLYADEFKAQLVRQCLVPGASVSATGMAHGVNANLLRRWIVLHRAQGHAVAPALLPVTVQAPSAVSAPASNSSSQEIIEIEIHGARVRLCGDVNAQRLGAVLDVLAHRA